MADEAQAVPDDPADRNDEALRPDETVVSGAIASDAEGAELGLNGLPGKRRRTRRASDSSRRRAEPSGGSGSGSPLRAAGAYLRAYVPLMVLVVLAGTAIWGWSAFGPKPPTQAELQSKYSKIEAVADPKWTAATTAIGAAGTDFTKLHAGYQSFYDATKQYVDAIQAAGDWGTAKPEMDSLVSAGRTLLTTLDPMVAALNTTAMQNAGSSLSTDYTSFTQSMSAARTAIGLPAQAASPAPTGSLLPSESASPSGSASASPTGSASPSSSAGATPSISPSPIVSASPAPSAS